MYEITTTAVRRPRENESAADRARNLDLFVKALRRVVGQEQAPRVMSARGVRFAKLPSQFGFAIEYTDSAASLRYYEPDFVAVLEDGAHRLVETKGREDPDVAHKDRAARLCCENATALTGTAWEYVKVPQAGFEKLEPERFDELGVFVYEWAR